MTQYSAARQYPAPNPDLGHTQRWWAVRGSCGEPCEVTTSGSISLATRSAHVSHSLNSLPSPLPLFLISSLAASTYARIAPACRYAATSLMSCSRFIISASRCAASSRSRCSISTLNVPRRSET